MTRRDKQFLAAWQLCVDFNDAYPVGESIEHDGELKTITAQAFVLPNGVAYIYLDEQQTRLTECFDAKRD
jgi:hypothetical protein